VTDERDLPAGRLSSWMAEVASGDDVDVPCGTCTACCRSSFFIHLEPDEQRTIAAIPRALLFPAPGRPKGHLVLGYDERGHCPMLVEDRCSIYDVRPRTCRRYDCRVYAAAGLDPLDDDKPLVAAQVRRWHFVDDDGAVRAVAVRLRASGDAPRAAGDVAMAAVVEVVRSRAAREP
jgi:hypothetical protein